MPKSPISYVFRFNAKDKVLQDLQNKDQGTLLSKEEEGALSSEGLQEYMEYVFWVYSPKRRS